MPRKRSPHPGIVVRPGRPERGEAPHIRYKDPASGKYRTERLPTDLDPAQLAKWLARHSIDLQTRRLASQPPPGRGLPVPEAFEQYFVESHVAESTKQTYRYGTLTFVEWGKHLLTGDLDLATLRKARAAMYQRRLSPHTFNSQIAALKAVLNHLRKAGLCSRLTRDVIKDGLERVPAPKEASEFLMPGQITELLVTLRDVTPLERAFVLTILLTGMRRSEAESLRWSWVDLESGQIRLPAARTKTRRWRVIDLSVCPSVKALLAELPRIGELVFGLSDWDVRELRAKLPCTYQQLRETTATYLTCAPGIYGAASLWMSAKQLGHSPKTAEDHYLGLIRISPEAKTLEEAMGLDAASPHRT